MDDLVSTVWLEQNRHSPDLAIVDCSAFLPTDRRDVVRRRVLRCLGPKVVGLEDDLLAPELAPDDLPVIGEGALMAALSRARGHTMRDIVATIQAEQDRRMAALINCARPRHRQTIRLTYIEGLTQGEAARRLRVSTGTIKRQLHRGLADIRRAVCES